MCAAPFGPFRQKAPDPFSFRVLGKLLVPPLLRPVGQVGLVANGVAPLHFDPRLLLTSDYGITFCATVPVVVAVLSLFYPAVNPFVLRVTSLVGLVIGSFNGLSLFIVPGYSAWLFVLHIPLIVLSIYGLLLPRVVRRELPTQGSLESSG